MACVHRLLGNGFLSLSRGTRYSRLAPLLQGRSYLSTSILKSSKFCRWHSISRPHLPVQPQKAGQEARSKWQLLLLVIPVTTFCLGTWQIYRLQWKLKLIDELERKTRQSPFTIPLNILDRVDNLEYCRVTLNGYYDHSREIHMWPRTLNTNDVWTRPNTEPGACIITPFYCYELENWVLVNRGWVPHRKMDPSTRLNGQVDGDVTLTAVVRTQEKRALFAPENDPSRNYWSYKDVERMAKHADTVPLFLDADATTTVHGGPIGGQTRVNLRNEHMQYIFTWYALSLFTAYMFYILWTKTGKKNFK